MVQPCQHFFCGDCHNNRLLNNNGCSSCGEAEASIIEIKFLDSLLDKYYVYKKPLEVQ
jgi:hypothetical protein